MRPGLTLFKTICFATTCLLCAFSCGDSGGDEPTPNVRLSASQTVFSFEAEADSQDFTFDAASRPNFVSDASWCIVKTSDYSISDHNGTATMSVTANSSTSSREASVTMRCGDEKISLTVSQAGIVVESTEPVTYNNTAWSQSEKLGLGWNMGNHFDAFYNYHTSDDPEKDLYDMPSETAWQGELCTQATFTRVKAAGFSSVRIPITWLRKIGSAPDYKIDENWMNRIYEVVGYAENAGLNVIINTHHDEDHGDGHWLNLAGAVTSEDVNTQVKAEITAVWTQIANKFKDKGDWLIFESFNELIAGSDWSLSSNAQKRCDIINQWNQTFVTTVRATGGNNNSRWLGVPTYAASPSYLDYFEVPSDPAKKTMVSVHFYDPYDYTIGAKQYSDWGHTGSSSNKVIGGDEDHVKDVFHKLNKKYIANNIPVYLGEFGCSMRAKSDTRAWKFFLYYLEYVVKAARSYGMPCFLWDNGASGSGQEQHGYINHGTGNYIGNSKEAVDVMVKARTDNSSGYTLDYVYNNAPKL